MTGIDGANRPSLQEGGLPVFSHGKKPIDLPEKTEQLQ
jgi:hypothetical protein